MKKMENENSVNLKEYIESNDYYYIIMEYCEYNLETFLKQKREKPFSINEVREVLNQLNNTFKLMIKEKIIHRDLKPSNILISQYK
jgi:serine/threonine protein kinase